jgi:hypothetical protein
MNEGAVHLDIYWVVCCLVYVCVQALLQHLYLSFFPTRSQFELPFHLENRYPLTPLPSLAGLESKYPSRGCATSIARLRLCVSMPVVCVGTCMWTTIAVRAVG